MNYLFIMIYFDALKNSRAFPFVTHTFFVCPPVPFIKQLSNLSNDIDDFLDPMHKNGRVQDSKLCIALSSC